MSRAPSPAPDSVRAFVALELSPALKRSLLELCRQLEPRLLPGIRWVRPEGTHLTLRFLGGARAEQLEQMVPRLESAAAECPPCAAPVGGLGVFPPRGSPRVLWIAIRVPQSILRLQAACERCAVAAGFAAERRDFRPHLTLGRWPARAARPRLPEADLGSAELSQLVLYRSELRPEGAVHTALARFGLTGARDSQAGRE